MYLKFFLAFIVFHLSYCEYDEKYRPQFHFSAPKGWLNDPNGLVYHDGVYELYYQYFPDKNGGRKYWGHARSNDLLHWTNLRPAMNPFYNDNGNVLEIWSGSAIMDTKNLTGFQSHDSTQTTLLAYFAAHPDNEPEAPWLAYSIDGGIHFQYHDKNPVIPSPKPGDFRDPKILEYEDRYVAVVAETSHVYFYDSTDLVNWNFLGTFENQFVGGVWECVDLFPLKYNDEEKWILTINSAWRAKYFIGSFDGKMFKNENPDDDVRLVDDGQYSYAGVTYNSAPDNRRIFVAWADDSGQGPTDPWRNIMTLPREFTLVDLNGKPYLSSKPVDEIKNLYTGKTTSVEQTIQPNTPIAVTGVTSNLLDITLEVNIAEKDLNGSIGIEFKGQSDSVRLYLSDKYFIDCTNAKGLSGGALSSIDRLAKDNSVDMRIILDNSIIELFADNGLTVKNNQFYTEDKINENIQLFYEAPNGAKPLDVKLQINELKSAMQS